MTEAPQARGTRIVPFLPGSYGRVLALQHELVSRRARGEIADTILVGEHERVVTLGRGTRLPPGALPIPVQEVERGGQATWHGPGQVVAYPLIHLRERGFGPRDYLRALEEVLIRVLAAFGVEAERREGATGVWVAERKIASLGIAVRRQVSYHGLALNVSPDLRDFQLIQPCGFAPDVMTSLAVLQEPAPSVAEVTLRVVQELIAVLGLSTPLWESAFDSSVSGPGDASVTSQD